MRAELKSVWERFSERCIEKAAPGLRWDAVDPLRVFPFTNAELMALRQGLSDGRLETAYDAAGNLVIRAPRKAEAKPDERPIKPQYEISPAIEALRARKRALGR